ncbi:hypothetical protein PPERSA_10956 [Pseudocohnilembus persalinus]|uniref:60S ribosomal protein L36 n=1 Tax=Pseudocohnilembus persalinus TaxID=266149 RepID=A0A0V0QC67_PSEPJ|nr:hypothetical protein PPERSA_10956 [Pseudocohnilembus persalinus]|eukprot:KRW99837.1 hypothetical protein PPERSA_10956 [Pseudocohnilembus persalinus]
MAKGQAYGINKGFVVTKLEGKQVRSRPVRRKGTLGKRVQTIRELIREVTGLSPYEKRMVELIKVGGQKELKKALKFAKARLGTHRRGLRKRALLEEYVRVYSSERQERMKVYFELSEEYEQCKEKCINLPEIPQQNCLKNCEQVFDKYADILQQNYKEGNEERLQMEVQDSPIYDTKVRRDRNSLFYSIMGMSWKEFVYGKENLPRRTDIVNQFQRYNNDNTKYQQSNLDQNSNQTQNSRLNTDLNQKNQEQKNAQKQYFNSYTDNDKYGADI